MAERFEFGEYHLDARERQLSRQGQIVRLEPRSFDLLHYLLQNAGRLVRKDELINAVWANAVVTDNALTRCMHQVRMALGDHADSPTYIETVPGSGYRFVAPVRMLAQQDSMPATHEVTAWRSSRAMAIFVIVAAAAAAFVWSGIGSRAPAPVIERLAVLPLTNLTGDDGQLYIVQGLQESIITELSRTSDIDVISRTSVMRYQDTDVPVPEIARALDVDALVEGSVMRSGNKLTITVQLIAAGPERHLWSKRYEGGANEVVKIATDIASTIASEIGVTLYPVENAIREARWSVDPEAYEAYLKGRFSFERKTPESYRDALELFRHAIDVDPDFAPAYVELGHTIASSSIFGLRKPGDSMPRARELAEKALSLDPDLDAAYQILAGVSFYWDWDWSKAEEISQLVLERNPNSESIYRLLAEIYAVTDRHDLAVDAVERSRELDPMLPSALLKPVFIYYLNRDYEATIANARSVLEFYPRVWQGQWLLCLALVAEGNDDQGIDACDAAVSVSGRTPMALGALGYAYARADRVDEAQRILHELEEIRTTHYVPSTYFAIIHGALGTTDLAIQELEQAYRDREYAMIHIADLAYFDSLRTDERFNALQARVESPSAR